MLLCLDAASGCAPVWRPAIITTITSDTFGSQLALGYLRNIYVTHGTQSGCPKDAIYVYAHDSAGNAAPLRILSGSATRLAAPYSQSAWPRATSVVRGQIDSR
jgi:hypothetical protein